MSTDVKGYIATLLNCLPGPIRQPIRAAFDALATVVATIQTDLATNTATLAGGSVLVRRTLTLTDAQIKAWPTRSYTLIPAPSTGYWNHVVSVSYHGNFAAGGYTNIHADAYATVEPNASGTYLATPIVNDSGVGLTRLTAFMGDGANGFVHCGEYSEAAIASTGVAWNIPTPYSPISYYTGPTQAVFTNNGAGALTGGHPANSLKITVYYILEAF